MSEIFDNQAEVIENIKDSAHNLGMKVGEDKREDTPSPPPLVVNSNCKLCWGKGWVTCSFPGNKGNEDVANFYCTCVKQVKNGDE